MINHGTGAERCLVELKDFESLRQMLNKYSVPDCALALAVFAITAAQSVSSNEEVAQWLEEFASKVRRGQVPGVIEDGVLTE